MSLKVELKPYTGPTMAQLDQASKNGAGSDGGFSALFKQTQTQQSEAAAELEKYAKMSPGERMASAIRKELGITDDQYNAMSPEQKAAVDAKVAQLVKQKMDEQMAQKQNATTAALKSGISL